MKRICLILTVCLLTSSVIAQTEPIRIQGTVVSADDLPLIGVDIKSLSGSTIGQTDRQGGFDILLNGSDSLTFSAVGYRDTALWIEQTTLNLLLILSLQDHTIEEVIVNTGYQRIKANQINGSVTVIGRDVLDQQVGPNILSRLDGVSNGLAFQIGKRNQNPQNTTGITIRGYGTINGPLDPLIVLDDFVYEGSIDNINPDDIESITLLKDAEATSIYGARGGNGVIIMTSKKGRRNQPIRVSINGNMTATQKPDLFALPQMANEDYIGVEEMLFAQGFFDRDLTIFNAPPMSPIVYLLDQRRKGEISEESYLSKRDFLLNSDFRKEYTDVFYKNSLTQQYHLGLTGGSGQTGWSIGAGHNRISDEYGQLSTKNNLRATSQIMVQSWLRVNLSGLFTQQVRNSTDVPSYSYLTSVGNRQSVPYMYLYDQQGQEARFDRMYSRNLFDNLGIDELLDWNYYPVSNMEHNTFRNNGKELLGSVGMELDLTDGVSLTANYQRQTQDNLDLRQYDEESYYVRNLVNTFTQINNATGAVSYPVPKGRVLSNGLRSRRSQGFRSQLNVDRSFLHHQLIGMLGMELREVVTKGESWTHYGYIPDPLGYLPVDYVGQYVTWPLGGFSPIPGSPFLDPTVTNRFVSLYGNINYTYRDRYSLSGNIRRDGSNIYGVTTNDKWSPLWSLAVGYDATKEYFMAESPFSQLRLRWSLGYSGNVDLSRSALPVAAYSTNPVDLGGLPRASITTLNNPSLRWEKVRQMNIGIDFAFKKRPLRGTLEFYTKSGSDLYGPTDYDYTTWGGAGTIVRNIAAMRGRGVDASLSYGVVMPRFRWDIGLIYNYNTNETSEYYDDQINTPISRIISSNGTQITPVEGYPLYALAAYTWKGLDEQGDPLGYLHGEHTKDYTALMNEVYMEGEDSGAVKYVGSALPTHFGALMNTFVHKDFTISFNLTYRLGYYFRKSSISYTALVNRGAGHADFAARWQQEGDDTQVPSFEYPLVTPNRDDFYLNSEVMVRRGDHIRLQFVNLGYTFRSVRFPKPIQGMNIYLNLSNLGVVWRANRDGIDPDYAERIPSPRTLTFGIRTNF